MIAIMDMLCQREGGGARHLSRTFVTHFFLRTPPPFSTSAAFLCNRATLFRQPRLRKKLKAEVAELVSIKDFMDTFFGGKHPDGLKAVRGSCGLADRGAIGRQVIAPTTAMRAPSLHILGTDRCSEMRP
jgi:hypothetical protein